jgi:DHA3 family multidrug efflux protein-like MFS transporter
MDPYGLTLFNAQMWGFALAFASTGFLIGGGLVAKFGLGAKPMRTLLLVVIAMGLLGSVFMLREWWPLYVIGMWIYMALVPPVEAAEQTIIQKVVRYDRQGRVFGVAAAMEAAAAPITAFLIAPIAEFLIIPYMKTDAGQQRWEWLLGEGEARGIALICLFAGLIMVVAATLAFFTKSYRKLTDLYANAPEQDPNADGIDDSASDASAAEASDETEADGVETEAVSSRGADAPPPVRGLPPEVPEARR